MKRILMALLWGFLSAGAHAQTTFAEIAITHVQQYVATPTGNVVLRDEDTDLIFRLDEDGSLDTGFEERVGGLQVGQSVVTVYDYTMTVSVGGRSYPPSLDYCTPLAFISQCINPNGSETAFAQLIVGHIDPRVANPFLNYIGDEVTLWVSADAPPRVESGQLTAIISTTSDMETGGSYGVLAFLAVFASPIPEPSSYALMLAGIGLLAVVRWRARHGRGSPCNA